jgi:hypothetical protein
MATDAPENTNFFVCPFYAAVPTFAGRTAAFIYHGGAKSAHSATIQEI